MTDRIQELIDQATSDIMGVKVLDKRMFAELIVRECAQVCLSQRNPANLNYKPSERFAEAVKQHFGVEE
jgi:hypothetical protein